MKKRVRTKITNNKNCCKAKDHCLEIGKCRGAAHNICN